MFYEPDSSMDQIEELSIHKRAFPGARNEEGNPQRAFPEAFTFEQYSSRILMALQLKLLFHGAEHG